MFFPFAGYSGKSECRIGKGVVTSNSEVPKIQCAVESACHRQLSKEQHALSVPRPLSLRSTTHAHSISPSHYRRLSLSPPFSTMASSLPSNGPSAATQANDILREDAKKGNTTVHTFDPDATPEQKAAAAGKGRDQLKSVVDTNKDAVASKGIFITSALHILPYP